MTAAPAPALANEQIHSIPLKLLDPSPFHHRHNWGDLEELAASFKDVGVMQPGTCRRVGNRFEIVYGHRRDKAARIAKLQTIPMIIRVLSDAQAMEMQAIENLQREAPHPMDEAEDFAQLHKLRWSAEDMAGKIGKSRAYVFERMKLLDLCKKLREAFYKDEMGASVALYLARLPSEKLQLEAWKAVQVPAWEKERGVVLSARRALKVISEGFMLRLADAPFDRGDATLVPAAGTCKDCPKRTGNQAELFADVKSADVCTDPACFKDKTRAHGKRELESASDKGIKVLEGKAAESAIRGSDYYHHGAYIKPTEKNGYDGKTFAQLAKGSDVQPVLAVGSDGLPVKLLPRQKVLDAAKKSGLLKKERTTGSSGGSTEYARQKKEREAAQSKRVATYAIMGAVCAKAAAAEPKKGFWTMLARALIEHVSHDQGVEILKRRAGDDKEKVGSVNAKNAHGSYDQKKKLLAELDVLDDLPRDEGAVRAFAVEMAIAGAQTLSFHTYGSKELGKPLLAAAEHYGLDANDIALRARRAAAVDKKLTRGAKKAAKK